MLTVTGATAADKVYDGTLAATTTGATLSGVVSGDDVYMTATTTGVFASADVSDGIAVTSDTSLAGTDAPNYTLTQQSGMTANITEKPLDITGAAATSRAYDGTTVATITGATLDGIIGEDDVYLTSSSTGTFEQATPATGINVTTAMGLAGDDAGNYSIDSQPTLSANIYTKTLHVTGGVAQDKVYDGNDVADIGLWVMNVEDIVGSDEVTVTSCEGKFDQESVGENINVSIYCEKEGAQESYYTISATDSTASITPKMLTVVGASVTTKNYDGNTDATITGATLDGVVEYEYTSLDSDNVVLGNHTSGTFASKYPGSNIPVATAMTISGDHAGNYTLQQPTLIGTIKSTGGGGGGSSITFCSAVSYGEWGECTGGFQYRDVLTKTPTACTLTTEQQLDGQRLCVVGDEDGEENEEQGSGEENNENEEGSDDSSSDLDVVGVMNRERNKVLNVNRVLSTRMAGRILLQVEENGEAWYVDPKSTNKYFMGRPADAFQLMRNFGLGISEANYNNFSTSGVPAKYAGQILLRVEKNGEAYYINPDTLEMHYLGRPADAFRIMRELALGISNDNLRQIQVGE